MGNKISEEETKLLQVSEDSDSNLYKQCLSEIKAGEFQRAYAMSEDFISPEYKDSVKQILTLICIPKLTPRYPFEIDILTGKKVRESYFSCTVTALDYLQLKTKLFKYLLHCVSPEGTVYGYIIYGTAIRKLAQRHGFDKSYDLFNYNSEHSDFYGCRILNQHEKAIMCVLERLLIDETRENNGKAYELLFELYGMFFKGPVSHCSCLHTNTSDLSGNLSKNPSSQFLDPPLPKDTSYYCVRIRQLFRECSEKSIMLKDQIVSDHYFRFAFEPDILQCIRKCSHLFDDVITSENKDVCIRCFKNEYLLSRSCKHKLCIYCFNVKSCGICE